MIYRRPSCRVHGEVEYTAGVQWLIGEKAGVTLCRVTTEWNMQLEYNGWEVEEMERHPVG